MFTVALTWSRPTLSARENSSPNPNAGFARRSASTVEAWLIVTSSSTPSAPITIPARRSPSSDTPPSPAWRKIASSLDSPVRWVRSVNRTASAAVSSRLTAVPSSAARLFGPRPCASGIVMSAIASAPTTATASGG